MTNDKLEQALELLRVWAKFADKTGPDDLIHVNKWDLLSLIEKLEE